MSDETTTTTIEAIPDPETTTDAVTRDRRAMPAHVFERISEKTWRPVAGPFPKGITEAETWIKKNGEDGKTYWPLRGPEKATQIEPRRFSEVAP